MAQGAMEVLLEKERPGMFEIISSGASAATGFPATMYAIEAAKIWACDISGHKSRPLTVTLIDRSDLIFAMTPSHADEVLRLQPEAKSKTYLLKNFPTDRLKGEGVDDPIGLSLDRYNETFVEIGEYLGKHLSLIVEKIDEKSSG